MAALEALDKAINEHDSSTSESVTGSVDSVQRMPDLLVESTNNGLGGLGGLPKQSAATEENNNKANSKVYASVSEMKRMKVNKLLQFCRSYKTWFWPKKKKQLGRKKRTLYLYVFTYILIML